MLNRRQILGCAASLPRLSAPAASSLAATISRARPNDPRWPTATKWDALRRQVEGNLIARPSPLDTCRSDPAGQACAELFRELKNPYFIGDNPALTQTCGWIDAWTAQPSAYVAAVRTPTHVAAAV